MAVAGPLAMLLLRLRLDVLFEHRPMMVLFVMPMLVASYFGGLRAGLLATALSGGLLSWFFIPPAGSFLIANRHDLLQWLILLANGVLIAALCELLHWHRRRSEQTTALQQQLNQLAAAVPGALYAFHRTPDGRATFRYTNDAFAKLMGAEADADLTDVTHTFQRIHPDDLPAFLESVDRSEKTLEHWHGIFRLQHPARGIVWIEGFSIPERQPDGSTLWNGFAHDITERKRAELALQELEQRWHFALEGSGAGVWDWNLETNAVQFSRVWKSMLGYAEDEIRNELSEWNARVHPDDLPQALRDIQAHLDGHAPYYENEHRLRCKDGSYKWILDRGLIVARDATGKPLRMVGTHTDISDLKQSVEALRESEQRFRAYVEKSPVAIMVLDRQGRYQDCNPAASRLLGYEPAALKQLTVGAISINPAASKTAFAQLSATGEFRGDYELKHRDGQGVWVSLLATALPGDLFIVFCVDITAQRAAERLLRLQSAALQAADNAIVITDARGTITWVNPAFCANTGYAEDEVVGHNPRDLVKSGVQDEAFYQQLWATIRSNRVWRGQLVNRRKNGTQYTEEMTITPVRDDGGALTNFVAIKQDITERKQLEAQLLRNQRLESVGRLASGIAHDLNNILTPVLMAPALLREAVQDPAALSLIDSVESSAKRGAAIIKQLLLFGRGTGAPRAPVSMRTLLRDMMKIIEETFPKNIRASADIPGDLALVNGNATQLHQVLMNLCVNARDAMPIGGTLKLSVAPVTVDEEMAAANPGAKAGPHYRLTVEDTGHGIDPGHIDKLFDPYFSTKPSGEGTGLGLSISMAIIRDHEGFITVHSQPGRGTAFSVYLPAMPTPAVHEAAEEPPPPPSGHGELVLVVDDEEEVRKVTCRLLERHGYASAGASGAAHALELLAQPGPPVRAIITDLMMPDIDGHALVRMVRARYPKLPIILISGHDAGHGGPDAVSKDDVQLVLQKPADHREILTGLYRIIHLS